MTILKPALVSFDTETTGTDPETARIVSAAIVALAADGTVLGVESWLIDPGVPVPDEAAAIHGITTDYVREHGHAARGAVGEICDALQFWLGRGIPVTTYNARYDWTLLDREARRHGLNPLEGDLGATPGLWFEPRPIFDPLVIDKALDKYRKGSRKLGDVAAHHGVTADGDLHGAEVDATLAGRVMLRLLEQNPALAEWTEKHGPGALHDLTRARAGEQADSLRDHFRRSGKPYEDVRSEWPLVPFGGA